MKLNFDESDLYLLMGLLIYAINKIFINLNFITYIGMGLALNGAVRSIAFQLRPYFCIQFDSIQLLESLQDTKRGSQNK